MVISQNKILEEEVLKLIDLSNYATKADSKSGAAVGTSKFA